MSARGFGPALLGLTLFDLAVLGFGLNPAIAAASCNRVEPPVIARLRQELPPGGRALGVGEELPPNVLMRFGLADVRNYDSVELARSLRGLRRSTNPAAAISSRSEITWERVIAAASALTSSRECARSWPRRRLPTGLSTRVEQVGRVWIAWLDGKPWAESESARRRLDALQRPRPGPHSESTPQRAPTPHGARDLGPGMDGTARRQARRNPAKIGRFLEYRNSSRPT